MPIAPTLIPKTAIYTVRTRGNGVLKEWHSKDFALAFLTQSLYQTQNHFNHVILHTDSYGKYLLRDINFDEVIVTLDNFDIDPSIRSAAKLDSYSRQKEPFVHLDWDFILWKKLAHRMTFPVIAQSRWKDITNSKLSLIWRSISWKPSFVEDILEDNKCVELPCPAFLGGTDIDFLSWYSKLALEVLRHSKNRFIQQMAHGELSQDISVAMEQWLLGACAMHRGIPINYLSDTASPYLNSNDPLRADELGFTHLAGDRKRELFWVEKIPELNAEFGISKHVISNSTDKAYPLDGEVINLRTIPYKALISVEKQKTRRDNALRQFSELGLNVKWKIPPKAEDIHWTPMTFCYKTKPAAASHALALIEILNEAQQKKAQSLLLFEDDIVFHPEINTLLPLIKVPRDWKIIYLGGRNCGIKEKVSRGLFKSNFIADLHAIIIKADIIEDVKKALIDPCINSVFLDFRFATLHNKHPAYLCRPNLAWQSAHSNDSGGGIKFSNYEDDGTVKHGQGD